MCIRFEIIDILVLEGDQLTGNYAFRDLSDRLSHHNLAKVHRALKQLEAAKAVEIVHRGRFVVAIKLNTEAPTTETFVSMAREVKYWCAQVFLLLDQNPAFCEHGLDEKNLNERLNRLFPGLNSLAGEKVMAELERDLMVNPKKASRVS